MKIQHWQFCTKLEKVKHASAILLSLKDKNAVDACLEIEIDKLQTENGVKVLLEKLDTLYLKDELLQSIDAYEEFESFRRPDGMKISDYKIEFDRKYNRAAKYDMTVKDGVLAYRFLKSANLSEQQQQLVKATVDEMKYSTMVKKLNSIFLETAGEAKEGLDIPFQIKSEPVFYGSSASASGSGHRGSYRGSSRNKSRGKQWSRHQSSGKTGHSGKPVHQKNPVIDGVQQECYTCHSWYHYAWECPITEENVRASGEGRQSEVTLYCKRPIRQNLLGEALGCAILDSGCPKPVAGEPWINCYLETLSEKEFADVKVSSSGDVVQFGDGAPKVVQKKIRIPIYADGIHKKLLWVNVVESDIPLLFSESTMGRYKMAIDFGKRILFIDNVKQDHMFFSSSGHYCLPIGKKRQVNLASVTPLANSVIQSEDGDQQSIWLAKDILVEDMTRAEKKKIAGKLHRQFSHASPERLISLIKDAGIDDEELLAILRDVNVNCTTCIKYKRSCPRPAVGLPMAKEFNETLAMDLKEITGHENKLWFLHIIDMATRYSSACIVDSKNKELIVQFLRSG